MATKKMNPGMMAMMKKKAPAKKMAMGGSASSRADGIARKGKTKGKDIKMCSGGMK